MRLRFKRITERCVGAFKVEEKKMKNQIIPRFGTFGGVFLPSFLSIIGVILYLRLGYIVGAAGLLGTIIIILLAVSTTIATGLSLSSITTNIRIGAGGAYSIISKSFGLEVGGSVGIPLLFAQMFSVALYIFGFTEGWLYIFPDHPRLLVVACAFILIFLLTFVSTKLAIKSQYFIFALILASLIVVFISGDWYSKVLTIPLKADISNVPFWSLFALFFPAVTGLMAGIGMSGELKDPKKQIPRGIIWALVTTTIIYLLMAFWYWNSASPEILMKDNYAIINLSLFAPIVLAGLLASTFSSALTTFLAGPRLLQSMGDNFILPWSRFFAKRTSKGIPHNAIISVTLIILSVLLLGNLDAVAPVLTMFFLITYAMLNIIVFIEQSLGLVSFRPTLRIPKFIPLYGAVSSVVFMFLINAIAGMVAVVFLFLAYVYIMKRKIAVKEGDVRSGLFVTMSEWAAKKVLKLPGSQKHTWKPNVLVPVVSTSTLLGNFPLIKSMIYPHGTMSVLGVDLAKQKLSPEEISKTKEEIKKELKELPSIVKKFGEEGIFTSSTIVSMKNYTDGVCTSLEAMGGQVFHPNVLFLPFQPKQLPEKSLSKIFSVARKHKVGIVLFDRDKEIGLGSEEDIHVWIPPFVLDNNFYADRGFDLAMLIAYKLYRNWVGKITLSICVPKSKIAKAKQYMRRLVYEARFPSSTEINVSAENFRRTLAKAPKGDIHIIPVTRHTSIADIRKISEAEKKSFLFVADSSKEDILA